ncbi:hypothetical protein [Bifidobacterium pseudolongum]|uniref:hypothetical protein n=1 Tax=Bifidobacterium pseudolongum TaxID=1694 RepID=UPI0010229A8D|nr:hypothetical protein [Bifidobacterium pseudolongum]
MEVIAMAWRSINDLANDLVGVITAAGIKAAAQRVGWPAAKQGIPSEVCGVRMHGRAWELDDDSEMVREWYRKKDIREAGIDALEYQSEAQGRIERLEEDRREAERELGELRSGLTKAEEQVRSLSEALEAAQKALEAERDKTSALHELAEERAHIIGSLTVALNAVTISRNNSSDASSSSHAVKASKASSEPLEGAALLDAWNRYETAERDAGRKPSKAAFARLQGLAPSTLKGRLAAAQRQ